MASLLATSFKKNYLQTTSYLLLAAKYFFLNKQTILSAVFMSSLRPLVFTIADLLRRAEPVVALHIQPSSW